MSHKKPRFVKDTSVPEDVSHQQISSYFIGPQAENLPYFENNIRTILKELGIARTNYFGDDGVSCSTTRLAAAMVCLTQSTC